MNDVLARFFNDKFPTQKSIPNFSAIVANSLQKVTLVAIQQFSIYLVIKF